MAFYKGLTDLCLIQLNTLLCSRIKKNTNRTTMENHDYVIYSKNNTIDIVTTTKNLDYAFF